MKYQVEVLELRGIWDEELNHVTFTRARDELCYLLRSDFEFETITVEEAEQLRAAYEEARKWQEFEQAREIVICGYGYRIVKETK